MAEWTTQDVRRMLVAHAHNTFAWEHGDAPSAAKRDEFAAAFDAWLAAHDAEVRAKALEDAADAIDLSESELRYAELHNAEAAAEVWLRDRARAERGEQ